MFGLLLAVIIFWGGAVAGYSAAAKVGGNSWQAAMVGLSIGYVKHTVGSASCQSLNRIIARSSLAREFYRM